MQIIIWQDFGETLAMKFIVLNGFGAARLQAQDMNIHHANKIGG